MVGQPAICLLCASSVREDGRVASREQRLAGLAVRAGARVQPSQDVVVLAFDVEQAAIARAVAEARPCRSPAGTDQPVTTHTSPPCASAARAQTESHASPVRST